MIKEKYIVAVDLDGVLWDLATPWIKRYNDITKEDVKLERIKSYHIENYVQHPGILYYLLEMRDFWENVHPYECAAEAINMLKSRKDVELIILTSTSYETAAQKFKRLFDVLPMLKYSDIVVAEKKNLIAADYLIDDYENNLSHLNNGNGILITQPYNKSFPNVTYGIERCTNVLEAVKWLLNDIDSKQASHGKGK